MNASGFSADKFKTMGFEDDADFMIKLIKEGFLCTFKVILNKYNEHNRMTFKRDGVSVRFDTGPYGASVNIFVRCSTGGYRKHNEYSHSQMNISVYEMVLGLKGGEIIRKYNVPQAQSFQSGSSDIYWGFNRVGEAFAKIAERTVVKATILGLVVISDDGRLSFDGVDIPDEKPWFLFQLERGAGMGLIYIIYSDRKYLACVKTSNSYRIVQESDRHLTKWKNVPHLAKPEHELVKYAIEKFQEGLDG